jgi:putative oxidoreductase
MLKQLWQDLFKPHVHLGSFLLRVGLAVTFIFHGYLKLAQDGGKGWHDTLTTETQVAVAWGEFVCGIALLFGFLSRLAALGLAVIMVGAIALQTGRFDYIYLAYIKSDPARVPTGAEYNVALIVMCMAVLALGSGKVSVDHLLFGRREEARV